MEKRWSRNGGEMNVGERRDGEEMEEGWKRNECGREDGWRRDGVGMNVEGRGVEKRWRRE